jgi:uncharacterized protein (TIGR03435 family)
MRFLMYLAFVAASPLVGQQFTFEVATIKPSHPTAADQNHSSMNNDGGSFRATNVTLQRLIEYALGVQSYQVSGGPGWVRADHFDLTARNERSEEAALSAAELHDGEATINRIRSRLRNLLETRFQLVLREETKELPVYALTADRAGSKLKKSAETSGNVSMNSGIGGAILEGFGMSMPRFCTVLGSILGRPVVDETGIDGFYDIQLKYAPEDVVTAREGALDSASLPSIFTTVREVLGLRLSGRKGPVATWVVTAAEKPTEN